MCRTATARCLCSSSLASAIPSSSAPTPAVPTIAIASGTRLPSRDRPQIRRSDRVRRLSQAMGRRTNLRMDQPKSPPGHGLRANHQIRIRTSICRRCHRPHQTHRSLRMRFKQALRKAPSTEGHRVVSWWWGKIELATPAMSRRRWVEIFPFKIRLIEKWPSALSQNLPIGSIAFMFTALAMTALTPQIADVRDCFHSGCNLKHGEGAHLLSVTSYPALGY